MLGALGWAYVVLVANTPEGLGEAANVGQIIGIPLTVLGIAIAVLTALRPATESAPEPPRVRLARQVNARESEVRAALLRSVFALDVTFNTFPGRPAPTPTGKPGAPGSGDTPLRRVKRVVARLVAWQETPAPSPDGSPDPAAPGNLQRGSLTDIAGYFTGLTDRRLVIVGPKGSGKTVLAIQLVIDTTQAIIDDPDTVKGPVPVRLSAASWTSRQSFAAWLTDQLATAYLIPPDEAGKLVEDHLVLPVLDGLDEMDPDTDDGFGGSASQGGAGEGAGEETANRPAERTGIAPPRAAALLEELNGYITGTRLAPLVVTTRPHRHDQLHRAGLLLDHGHPVTIQPLTSHLIGDYLAERYRDRPAQAAAWQPILERLDTPEMAGVREFLSTPWRLMLATTAIDADIAHAALLAPPGSGASAETVEQTCARLREHLLGNFVTAAVALSPPARRPYTALQVERWLINLAEHLNWQADVAQRPDAPRGMSQVDIMPHLLWPIGGRLLPRMLPRMLHFLTLITVLFTADTSLFSGIWSGNIRHLKQLLAEQQWGLVGAQALIPIFLLSGLYMVSTTEGHEWLAPSVSSQARRPLRDRIHQLAYGLVPGLVVGLAVGLTAGVAVGLVVGLASGLIGALAVALAVRPHSWEPTTDVASPHRAVHRDLASGLMGGLVFGVAAGFAFGLTAGHVGGLAFGLMVGLAFGIALGGAGVRYMAGIACAASRRRLPWRFAAFCRWACAAGLLRVAGTGYQFRHRELQEWLIRNR